jgi:hypothetical protein
MTQEEEYRKRCASMTPVQRLKMCFELSEWSMKLNKNIKIELARRQKGKFILK